MKDISKFIEGFERFQQKYFGGDEALFNELKTGQRPSALVIACSDSRVDPALLTEASPGDLFVVRNIANLVQPYDTEGNYPGFRAALEFAVTQLNVSHIIVLGHANCGGIKALMSGAVANGEFIGKWVSIANKAKERVLAELPDAPAAQQHKACEQASILVSLENLMTYPWINDLASNGQLMLHGWYFDLEAGNLMIYEAGDGHFVPLIQK